MDKELLNQAIKCLNIQDVFLRDSSIIVDDEFNPRLPKFSSIVVQFRNGWINSKVNEVPTENDGTAKLLSATYECAYRIVPPGITEEISNNPEEMDSLKLVEVKAKFIAEYLLTCPDLTSESIDVFCRNNVGYHVWPYWREYAQSSADRLRLPKVTVPLYTLPES